MKQFSDQAIAGSRFSMPGFSGTGFCQIPGSRDFSGRDLPLFSIPGLFRNFTGIFRDFCFCFVCWSVVKSHNLHQSLSLSLSPPHPQEGSRMSAQHMKRLSQMLPQTLTNWIAYLIFFTIFSRPVKGTPKKCVNLRQKLSRDKTAYLVFGVLFGVYFLA